MQEFNRDTRGLIFLDATVVSEAFLHHETRKLDNAGCFSFGDVKYEASTALANAEVEIAYDPMNTETIKVVYQDMKPIMAHRVSIGAFCDKTVDVPVGMTDKIPETSRFLDALEKKYKEDYRLIANLVIMERQVAAMYEEFFELMHTPFTRDIPADRLYSSRQIEDALGRLTYVADRQLR